MHTPEDYHTIMEVWNMLEEFTCEWALENPTPDEALSRAWALELQRVAEIAAQIEGRLYSSRTRKGEYGCLASVNPTDARAVLHEAANLADVLDRLVAEVANLLRASGLLMGREAEFAELSICAGKLCQEIASVIQAVEEGQDDCLYSTEFAEGAANNIGLVAGRPEATANACRASTAKSRRLWLLHRFILACEAEMFFCPPIGEPRHITLWRSPDARPSEDFPPDMRGQEQEIRNLRYALPRIDCDLFVVASAEEWRKVEVQKKHFQRPSGLRLT